MREEDHNKKDELDEGSVSEVSAAQSNIDELGKQVAKVGQN